MCEKKKKKSKQVYQTPGIKSTYQFLFLIIPFSTCLFLSRLPHFLSSRPSFYCFLCWKILELFILRLICSHIGQWRKRQEKFNASVLKMNTSDVHFLNSSNLCYILKLIYWLKFLLKLWGGCSLLIILFIFPRL